MPLGTSTKPRQDRKEFWRHTKIPEFQNDLHTCIVETLWIFHIAIVKKKKENPDVTNKIDEGGDERYELEFLCDSKILPSFPY